MFFINEAMAQGVKSAGSSSNLMNFLPMILLVVVFYFLLIRPQQKKQKQFKELLSQIKPGDKIITSGGIVGIVKSLKDATMKIEVSEGVIIEMHRNMISGLYDSIINPSKK